MTTPELPKGFFSVERDEGPVYIRARSVSAVYHDSVDDDDDGGADVIVRLATAGSFITAEHIDSVLRKIAAAQAEEA